MHHTRGMQSSVKRIYLALGAVCILTGAALLGIAAYGIFLLDDPQDQWVYVRPAWPDATPVVAGEEHQPTTPLESGGYRLIIDKLGVDAPVAPYGLDENSIPRVPWEQQLVAWYNFTSVPGAGDNAVFAGHKTWAGEAVFFSLEELENGDRIVLRAEDGEQLVYEVSEMRLVSPDDPSALDWMKPTGTDTVTLITCGGERFLTDTPAGADYTLRVVLRADRLPHGVASSSAGS